MKEYTIYYRGIEDGEEFDGIGSGKGNTEMEATADFIAWHGTECKKILRVVVCANNTHYPARLGNAGGKDAAMKEQLMKIIEAHNRIADAIAASPVKIGGDQVIGMMVISHKFACEGAEIARVARDNGIGCKIDMQAGRIIL